MSGVYLICWDEEKTGILQTTNGGYPHITIAYTGSHLNREALLSLGTCVLKATALKSIRCIRARVNTFMEKEQVERHDVLIDIDPIEEITAARTMLFQPLSNSDKFNMRPFHITHSIHYDLETATAMAQRVNTLLPHSVIITGVTID